MRSSSNGLFANVQWFVDQGAGPTPLSANSLIVREANGRRTVGGTVTLRQPFQPGRYFCQPRLLSNNSFLQPSQVFELKAISTYAGLLPCRLNDTLSVLSSRCADLYAPRSICTTSSVPMVTNAVIFSSGASICAGISVTGLTLLLVAVISVNVIICYLYRRKNRSVAKIQGAGDHEHTTSHRPNRNSANSTYYAYPEVPQSNRTKTVPLSLEHEVSSDTYHTPYSLSLPHPSSLPSSPSASTPSQYASLRGVAEYSQHYTSLLSSNRITKNQRDSDVSYI